MIIRHKLDLSELGFELATSGSAARPATDCTMELGEVFLMRIYMFSWRKKKFLCGYPLLFEAMANYRNSNASRTLILVWVSLYLDL